MQPPWWYTFASRRLRQNYSGVPPWEWERHPQWHDRVLTILSAEHEADDATRGSG